jgi:hypothetical protein
VNPALVRGLWFALAPGPPGVASKFINSSTHCKRTRKEQTRSQHASAAVRLRSPLSTVPAEIISRRFRTLPSRPGEFHPEPLTESGRDTLVSSGSCHRAKAAAFRREFELLPLAVLERVIRAVVPLVQNDLHADDQQLDRDHHGEQYACPASDLRSESRAATAARS